MKKYIIPLSMAAIILASCNVEEVQPVLSDGSHLVLTGQSSIDTKVSIGEKDGEMFPLLWFTGDVIGISSKDASVQGAFNGERANLYSDYSGNTSGLFQTVNELVPETDMDLVIVYPAGTASYENGVIYGTVPETQSQRSADTSIHVGNGCVAYGETHVSAGQTNGVSFALSHKTAFVKVVVSIDGYSDYNLLGVQMTAPGAALSGDVSYDISKGTMTPVESSETVGATISNTSAYKSGQAIYFTALPCDLTGTTVSMIVYMENSEGTATLPPIEMDGGLLKESYLTVINIGGSVDVSWYDPVEVRDLISRWAYGSQNTYFIEQYENKENSIKIDVRARGDFSKVTEPKYYGLLTGSCDMDSLKLCYLPNDVDYYEEKPVNTVNEDYTIDVYCYSQAEGEGNWATVGIYDEDYNILWSFMIWKYLSGDEPGDVVYSDDMILLDRNIGAPYSNKLAAQKGTFSQPAAAYFQHGRKDPFPWDPFGIIDIGDRLTASIESSIANPTIFYGDYTKEGNDWKNTDLAVNLWGGDNSNIETDNDRYNTLPGKKTVYDPCPKGYRVLDYNVLYEVDQAGVRWEVDNGMGDNYQNPSHINPDSPFYADGQSVVAYKLPDGTYDYWPFDGVLYGTNDQYKNRAGNYKDRVLAYWSCNQVAGGNNVTDTPEKQAYDKGIFYYSSSTNTTYYGYKTLGNTIRCQKEN